MSIANNFKHLHDLIIASCQEYHRNPDDIILLGVGKGQPASAIRQAYDSGLRAVGENYLQEALAKQADLRDCQLSWHFIGPIQSNKCALIAQHFDWVHSVDRIKVAQALNDQRTMPLNICIQINLDEEISKSGVRQEDLPQFMEQILQMTQLNVRGLMTIPAPQADEQKQFASLIRLKNLLIEMNKKYQLQLDTLSMGMSDDLKPAIRAGSTMLRIGRALFGERL